MDKLVSIITSARAKNQDGEDFDLEVEQYLCSQCGGGTFTLFDALTGEHTGLHLQCDECKVAYCRHEEIGND